MNKGDFFEVNIIDMSDEGLGIGKVNLDDTNPPFTIFVEGATFGEKVKCQIREVKKNYAKAKVVNIIEESTHLKKVICPYIDKCGGCGYGKLDYDTQLKLKEKKVIDKLTRIAKLDNPKVNPIIKSSKVVGYRNKAKIFTYNDIVGFKERKSNLVTDCLSCKIQDERAMKIASSVRDFLKTTKEKNIIDNIVVRTTNASTMVIINRKTKKDLDWEKLVYMMDDSIEDLSSVYLDDKVIAGSKTIIQEIGALNFEVSPLSFYQVNPDTMVKLYSKVTDYLNLEGDETVLDLYCGVGTIGIFILNDMAKKTQRSLTNVLGRIIGIESVKPAIIDANRNAVINGIVNARYIYGKAEVELPAMLGIEKLYKQNEINKLVEKEPEIKLDTCDYVVLDPPRAGCDKKLLDAVIKAKPEKIIYVSCDPGTLARDISYLKDNEYEFIEATPVDMFPDTTHVETVVLLSKGKIDSKRIRVEFPLDDMEITAFREKATYPQIKEYVLEHKGN